MDKRADKKKADEPFSGGGGAVDDLTPPTMKYGPGGAPSQSGNGANSDTAGLDATLAGVGGPGGGELTRLGATQIAPQKSASVKTEIVNSGQSPTIGMQQVATVIGGVVAQDLLNEKLLRDAPKIESNGRLCPALNGIPLLAKLGQGGMGAVYYGIHPRLRSEVAVKVLPFHLAAQDPSMIQRFYREAQIAAKVRSPHLVSVIDVNEESGLFFLVMEYVAGVTMGQYIKQLAEKQTAAKETVGMPELDAIDVMIAACMGLDAAHSNGVVHRDLKPENIMVPYKSRQNKVYDLKHSKLMDLGLARNEEGQQSLTGGQAAMGTPGYMAPEQALDAKTADKRSDVFGMGATVYALLTGRAPFRGDAVMKVLMATMHEPHEPVGVMRPDISAALAEVIDHCLDKRPENRYADAHQLMRAFKNCRRLIAPEGEFEGEEEGEAKNGLSGSTPFTSSTRGTATPNVNPTRPLTNYARAGSVLSTTKGQAAVGSSKKLPLMLAAAAVMLVVAGLAAYKFWPAGDPAVVVDPNINKQGGPQVEYWKGKQLEAFQNGHGQFLTSARRAIDLDGNSEAAKINLDFANNVFKSSSEFLEPPIREKAKADIEEVSQRINQFIHSAGVDATFRKVNAALADDRVDEAATLLKNLKPLNDAERTEIDARMLSVEQKRTQINNKKEALVLLASAQKPETPFPSAWEMATKAAALDAENAEIKLLLANLGVQKKAADAQKSYDDNMAKANRAFERKDFDGANDAVALALTAKPGDPTAQELDKKVNAQLGAKKLAEKEQKRASDYLKAFKEANELYKNKKAKEALEQIELARLYSLPANMPDVNSLNRDIKILIQDQEAAALQMKIKGDYDGKMTRAAALLKVDDVESFSTAIDYTEDAARLLPGTPEEKAALALKASIELRRTERTNFKIHNTAVSDARQIIDKVKNDNPEAALLEVDAALKKVNEALAIEGKIALDLLKDKTVAQTLQAQIIGKQKELQAIVAKRKQNLIDYNQAYASGEKFLAEKNYNAALKSFQAAVEPANALSLLERNRLTVMINKATAQLSEVNKVFVSVDELIKLNRFDEAMQRLTEAEKSMVDERFTARKAAVSQSIAELDGLAKRTLASAEASVKAGKLTDAIALLKTESGAHKSRMDLADTLRALQSVEAVVLQADRDAATYQQRFNNISGRLGTKRRLTQVDFKANLASLGTLGQMAADDLRTTGISAAAAEVEKLKSTHSVLISKLEKDYLSMEAAIKIEEQTSTPVPINNGGGGGGNTGGGGKERTGEK